MIGYGQILLHSFWNHQRRNIKATAFDIWQSNVWIKANRIDGIGITLVYALDGDHTVKGGWAASGMISGHAWNLAGHFVAN